MFIKKIISLSLSLFNNFWGVNKCTAICEQDCDRGFPPTRLPYLSYDRHHNIYIYKYPLTQAFASFMIMTVNMIVIGCYYLDRTCDIKSDNSSFARNFSFIIYWYSACLFWYCLLLQ